MSPAAAQRGHRYFIVYVVHAPDGTMSVCNGIIRASAPLEQMEHIEALERELSKDAASDGSARLVHFIPLAPEQGS